MQQMVSSISSATKAPGWACSSRSARVLMVSMLEVLQGGGVLSSLPSRRMPMPPRERSDGEGPALGTLVARIGGDRRQDGSFRRSRVVTRSWWTRWSRCGMSCGSMAAIGVLHSGVGTAPTAHTNPVSSAATVRTACSVLEGGGLGRGAEANPRPKD